MLDKFIKWAMNNGWNVISTREKTDLPDSIKRRYDIPVQWYNFICKIKVCENQSATKWFLTANDYYLQDNGFQWNDFEVQSLQYNDNEKSVISYWDKHLPIILCVDGDYSYFAINTKNGNIVYGCEPEYEVSTVIAENFNIFINNIISGEIVL